VSRGDEPVAFAALRPPRRRDRWSTIERELRKTVGPLIAGVDEVGRGPLAGPVVACAVIMPPEERAKTAIFGQNFGQAGAIDLFGPKYGLPNAISGHQNYFLWGPREYTGESVIVMQGRKETLDQVYASCEKRAHVSHPYSMPRDQFDVFYCRGLKTPLKELWPKVKNWH